MVIRNRGEDVLRKEIEEYFYVKDRCIEQPSIYLGNKSSKVILENGVEAWSSISSQCVQDAVANVEEYVTKNGKSLP